MNSSVETFFDLFSRSQFQVGLFAGAIGLLLLRVFSPRSMDWGLAVSAAAMIGIQLTVGRRIGTTVGLIALAVGGGLLDRQERDGRATTQPLAWLIIAVGAVLTTVRGGLSGTLWIQILTPIVAVVTGYCLVSWGRLPQRRLLGPLFAITAFGIWATVPDTDSSRVLVAVSLPLVLATLPISGTRISAIGAFPLAALVAWIAADGGEPRHGSIVGAWACVGLLVLLPLFESKAGTLRPWLVFLTHSMLVVTASRALGLWETGLSAGVGVLALAVVSYLSLSNLQDAPSVMPGQSGQWRR